MSSIFNTSIQYFLKGKKCVFFFRREDELYLIFIHLMDVAPLCTSLYALNQCHTVSSIILKWLVTQTVVFYLNKYVSIIIWRQRIIWIFFKKFVFLYFCPPQGRGGEAKKIQLFCSYNFYLCIMYTIVIFKENSVFNIFQLITYFMH